MYKRVAPEQFMIGNSMVEAVATLRDESGGVSHIREDDHCYVLYNGSDERGYQSVSYWYPEAVAVLQLLPVPLYACQSTDGQTAMIKEVNASYP